MKPRLQCHACPWKVSTNPHDIPGGYSPEKHAALKSTIAEPGRLEFDAESIRMMTCHEYAVGAEKLCVGWVMNQLGPGNNIALRLKARAGRLDINVRTVGPQHELFEDTLPKTGRAKRAKRAKKVQA